MRYWLVLGVVLLAVCADAYSLSAARPVKPVVGVKPFPSSILINSSGVDWLLGLHAGGGAWAYQAGYDDAVRDVLAYFGVKKPGFPKNMSQVFRPSSVYPALQVCYPSNAGFYVLNISSRLFEGSFNLTVRPAPGNRSVNRTVDFGEVRFNGPLKIWLR